MRAEGARYFQYDKFARKDCNRDRVPGWLFGGWSVKKFAPKKSSPQTNVLDKKMVRAQIWSRHIYGYVLPNDVWSKNFLQYPDSGSRFWNCFSGPSLKQFEHLLSGKQILLRLRQRRSPLTRIAVDKQRSELQKTMNTAQLEKVEQQVWDRKWLRNKWRTWSLGSI